MVFDIHFEKKTLHRQLRVEEHHAASKLAQVQMELWSEFHSDIKESKEAQSLLRSMNESYSSLQGKLKTSIHEYCVELNLNPQKAEKFADKLLHMVADMQQDNVKHAKHLVDHLVAAGKRSVKLEKATDRAMLEEAKEEKKAMEEDVKQGINAAAPMEEADKAAAEHTKGGSSQGEDEEEGDPLKEMLTGFFFTFNDFEKEFKGEPRQKLKDGNPVFEQIKQLYTDSQTDANEEDLQQRLDKIDLASIGAGLGSGRVLPVSDIIEEIALIPTIPHKRISELEAKWKKGEVDSVDVFEQLQEMHEKNHVPSGWLQQGVDQEENEEEREEAAEELKEESE
jgi:hypothetical protein